MLYISLFFVVVFSKEIHFAVVVFFQKKCIHNSIYALVLLKIDFLLQKCLNQMEMVAFMLV